MSKRLESGGNDVPEVCEGCAPNTKVKHLAERGALFWKRKANEGTRGSDAWETRRLAVHIKCKLPVHIKF